MNKNNQTTLQDIIDDMKRVFTQKDREYLEGRGVAHASVRFRDWHEWINSLKLTTGSDCPWFKSETAAKLRADLHRIADRTHRVGGRALRFGVRIMEFIAAQIAHYPSTLVVAVVMAAIWFLASSIPILGYILGPIVAALSVAIVGVVFLSETASNLKANFHCNH